MGFTEFILELQGRVFLAGHVAVVINCRVWWKKRVRDFWLKLPKQLQISHAGLFRCIKQCPVFFFTTFYFVFVLFII